MGMPCISDKRSGCNSTVPMADQICDTHRCTRMPGLEVESDSLRSPKFIEAVSPSRRRISPDVLNTGSALLQRPSIKARSNQQCIRDHQVGVGINFLQPSVLFQQNNMLRVGGNHVCRLTSVLRVGNDRRADLLRRAVVD